MDDAKSKCERGGRGKQQLQVTAAENATFVVGGGGAAAGLPASLALWSSNFGAAPYSASGAGLFVRGADVARPATNPRLRLGSAHSKTPFTPWSTGHSIAAERAL